MESRKRYTPDFISSLKPNEIITFGSNIEGFHFGGCARISFDKFGAEWGKGVGLYGQSYAIPTMGEGIESIKPFVDDFIQFAKYNPTLTFLVTPIGCGIAGYKPEQIAPLFEQAKNITNIILPKSFNY